MKKILWVTPILPYPPTTGGDIQVCQQLTALAGDYEQHLLCFYGAGQTAALADGLRPPAASVTMLKGTQETLPEYAAAPAVVNHHYASGMKAELRRQLVALRPDLVLFVFWFMALYVEQLRELRRVKTAALAVDLEYRRRCSAGESDWSHCRDWELRLLAQVDYPLAICARDAERLQRDLPEKRVQVVPVHVPVADAVRPAADGQAIAFVGALDHAPNADGLRWFMREGFPALRAQFPALQLYIVGRRPPADIRALADQDPLITVTGTVPDVAPYLRRVRLALIPLRAGSGIKTKIVEALGYGLPVVTTPVGREGLEQADGLLVAETAPELAGLAAQLLQDEPRRAALGAAGRAYYEREHSRGVFSGRVRSLLADLTR